LNKWDWDEIIYMQKTKTRSLSLTFYKKIKDLNVRAETFKILWETMEGIDIDNYFLSRTLVAKEIRARIDKWDCIKLKRFCTSKETTSRIKRQPTERENIFSSYSKNRRLIYRLYKSLKNDASARPWWLMSIILAT
jgi:hypothetical protein